MHFPSEARILVRKYNVAKVTVLGAQSVQSPHE